MGDGAPRQPYLRPLDGVRGLAVLAVIAFHLAPLDGGDRDGLLAGGWLGVDTFFTLSGFLITSLLLAEAAGRGRIDLVHFWRRRLRRLQPALLVAVPAVVLLSPWWAPAGTTDAVREQALAGVAALSNWQALWGDRPYAAGADPSAFEHLWSLAVEEQFYLVWPLVLAGVVALGGRRRAALAIALAGTAGSWAVLASVPLQRGYLGTDSRAGSVLVGAALAALLPLGTDRRWRGGAWLVAVGAGVSGALWVAGGWPPTASLESILPVHAVATAAVLAGVVLAPSSAPSRILGAEPLVLVGRASYGLYLWHWPVFVICTPDRLGMGELGTNAVRLLVTVALTAASWFLVEHPIRYGRLLRRTRLALPAGVAAALALSIVGVRGVEPAPAWAQADGEIIARSVPVQAAVSRVPTPARRVLVVGDSLPTSLLSTGDATREPGLQVGVGRLLDQLAERGIDAWSATITGCPVIEAVIVIDGHPWQECIAKQAEVYARALATARPDLVLWYSRQDAHPVLLPDGSLDTDPERLVARLHAAVDRFAATGAKVVFVSPGPNRDGHDGFAPLGSSRRSMPILERALTRVVDEHPAALAVIPMAELLCGDGPGCDDRMPDGSFYRDDDGVHFAAAGAVAAGAWLADRVASIDLSAGAPPGR